MFSNLNTQLSVSNAHKEAHSIWGHGKHTWKLKDIAWTNQNRDNCFYPLEENGIFKRLARHNIACLQVIKKIHTRVCRWTVIIIIIVTLSHQERYISEIITSQLNIVCYVWKTESGMARRHFKQAQLFPNKCETERSV